MGTHFTFNNLPFTVDILLRIDKNVSHIFLENNLITTFFDVFRMTHGRFEWTVSHRFKDFTLLHAKLSLHRGSHFKLKTSTLSKILFSECSAMIQRAFKGLMLRKLFYTLRIPKIVENENILI